MTHQIDLQHSVQQIRRRLFLLLMQAFGAVVLLTVVILLALVVFFVNTDLIGFGVAFTIGRPLESYYAGHGSWEGVAVILTQLSPILPESELDWQTALLLDNESRIVIDHGRVDTDRIGQPYSLDSDEIRQPLRVSGEQVGILVVQRKNFLGIPGVLSRLIFPVLGISFFTGVLTLLIGFLLIRRMVTPLAAVIGAAQAVAAGDLSTRVQERGPGDLASLSHSFNRMAGALERNDLERRNFLADIAHELRTPLTIIRGRLEGLVDGIYPTDEDHIAPVLAETYVLERLVEDLRTLTLAESRQLHFDQQSVDLGEVAQRAVDLFRAQADDKQLELSIRVAADTPTVVADPQRVGQVLGNLISNAIRYVPTSGKVIIDVRRGEKNDRVRVSVRDSGPGLAEADLPKLFDRFWRGDKSRARVAGGAGLGLAIAKQLIEAQGGQIWAANLTSGGFEVAFEL